MESDYEAPNNELSYSQLSNPQNDVSSMSIRLDSNPLLFEIETELRTLIDGKPKINDAGISSIMSYLRLHINPQVVQGNFYVDKHGYSKQYQQFMKTCREDFTDYIITKRCDWGMKDTDTLGIINAIMDCIELFISRPLGNGERISYNNTIQSKDTIVHQAKSGGLMKMFK